MPAIALQSSTIDLIAERMKRDGYSSPDVLVREALASLKSAQASAEPAQATVPEPDRNAVSDANEDLELDLTYEPVPLRQARAVDAAFVKAGELEMVPFGGNP